jgi:integrase/recombinase XerD
MPAKHVVAGDNADLEGMPTSVEEFCAHLARRGYSPKTIARYRVSLALFADWASARGVDRPRDVTRGMVERYQAHLLAYRQPNGKPLTVRSQLARLVALRQWFAWLARTHRVLLNPAADLDLPRVPRWQPRSGMTIHEVERVMAEPDLDTITGLRDRTILEVLYSTGVRASELADLAIADLDMPRGVMAVRHGKGDKPRMVPIAERATAWCEKYLLDARPRLAVPPDDGRLFLNERGRPFSAKVLTAMARRYLDAARITRPGACHLFRHTAATLMLEGGADIRYIQEFLGHADLNTTQLYTHVSIGALKAVHQRSHPGARSEQRATFDSDSGDWQRQADALLAAIDAEGDED